MPLPDPSEIVGVFRRSYRVKFTAALIAIVLVIGVFGFVIQDRTSSRLREDVDKKLSATAEVQSEEIDRWIQNHKTSTRLLSSSEALQDGSVVRVEAYLNRSFDQRGVLTDDVEAVTYIDLETTEVLASSPTKLSGNNFRQEGATWAQKPLEYGIVFNNSDSVYVSEPFRTEGLKNPVVAFVSPVSASGNRGVVTLVDVTEFSNSFQEPISGSSTVVLNPNQEVVMSEETKSITQKYEAPEKKKFLSVSSEVDTKNWEVVITAPKNEAYTLGNYVSQNILIVVLIALLGQFSIGLTIGRNTVRSINRLSSKTRQIEKGISDVDLETDRKDEIGDLYRSFDSMRKSLNQKIEEAEQAKELAQARQEELKQEKERLGALFENVPEPVVNIVLENGTPRVRGINPAFKDVFGYTEDEIVGKKLDEFIVPERSKSEAEELNRKISQGITHTSEVRRRTSEGERDFILQVVPFKVGEETAQGYAVYTDITESKERERRLKVLNRVLRHDLRNTMNVILGNAGIIREESKDEETKEKMSEIEEHAHELIALSEKARQIESVLRKSESERKTITINELVEKEVSRVMTRHSEAVVEVFEDGEHQVHVNDGIDVALENLIENAVEHNTSEEPYIGISVEEKNGYVSVSVEDNGPGIPQEEIEILSGEKEISQKSHTSGLGLWLVNWVVSKSGGELEFSETEKGSKVTMKLKKPEISHNK